MIFVSDIQFFETSRSSDFSIARICHREWRLCGTCESTRCWTRRGHAKWNPSAERGLCQPTGGRRATVEAGTSRVGQH